MLTPAQISAIRCAHADLKSALESNEEGDSSLHDWETHEQSIRELEEQFPEILGDQNDR